MTAKPTDRLQEPSRLPTWLLGVAMLLAIAVASVWNGYMGYRSVMEQQYHLLEVHAQQGEERIASSLRSVNLMLSLIIDDLGSRSPTRDADASRLLKSTLRQLPELRSLLVTDAAGRVITSNDDRLIGFVAAEREYFKVPAMRRPTMASTSRSPSRRSPA